MTSAAERGFLEAIAANPAEDAHRLAYLDWLEEQEPKRVKCNHCEGHGTLLGCAGDRHNPECGRCERGTVPDTSNADRAEFIRVQCEISVLPPKPVLLGDSESVGGAQVLRPAGPGYWVTDVSISLLPGTRVDVRCDTTMSKKFRSIERYKMRRNLVVTKCTQDSWTGWEITLKRDELSGVKWMGDELLKKEKELLKAHPDWSQLKCPQCRGKGGRSAKTEGGYDSEWMPCGTCYGTGDLLMQEGRMFGHAVPVPRNPIFRRGHIDSVSCTLAELGREIAIGGNQWGHVAPTKFTPSPWAVAVVRAMPVTRLTVSDRNPHHLGSRWRWWMSGPYSEQAEHSDSAIPEFLYQLVREVPGVDLPASYDTRELAIDALATVAAKLVRDNIPKEEA